MNVGFGNMVAIIFPNNNIVFYDCNLTNDNEKYILGYLELIMPKNEIDVFINSHRDADHMRGIKKLNEKYQINEIWDSGVSGNTDTPEYCEYMSLKKEINNHEVGPFENLDIEPRVKFLNGRRSNLTETNSQSIVVKIEGDYSSIMLAGDTDAKVWKDYIMQEIPSKVKSTYLLASHHGSISFFDHPNILKYYYAEHMRKINPDVTIISVGKNVHDLPNEKAVTLYRNHSNGTDKGSKIFRTDHHGNIIVELDKDRGSLISVNQL